MSNCVVFHVFFAITHLTYNANATESKLKLKIEEDQAEDIKGLPIIGVILIFKEKLYF